MGCRVYCSGSWMSVRRYRCIDDAAGEAVDVVAGWEAVSLDGQMRVQLLWMLATGLTFWVLRFDLDGWALTGIRWEVDGPWNGVHCFKSMRVPTLSSSPSAFASFCHTIETRTLVLGVPLLGRACRDQEASPRRHISRRLGFAASRTPLCPAMIMTHQRCQWFGRTFRAEQS